MWRFLLKLILFFIPALLLVFTFPLFVYIEGREFTPIEQVLNAQGGTHEALFGLAYSNATQTYKKDLVNASGARVLMLGASTVYGFRSSFFAPGSFINGTKAIVGPRDLPDFIQALSPTSSIKIIILGLEPVFFVPGRIFSAPEQVTLWERVKAFLLGDWRTPYNDYYFNKKFSLQTLVEQHANTPDIGMNALINNSGFRNDGSYYDGLNQNNPQHKQIIESEIIQTVSALQQDRSSWNYSTSTDPQALMAVQNFLALCKARGIYVIGFTPPYASPIYQTMLGTQDVYTAEMEQLSNTLNATFAQNGFPFFDYTDAAKLGIPDSEFIEEVHPGDKADLRILIDMASRDKQLQQYVNLPALQKMLASTSGDFMPIPR